MPNYILLGKAYPLRAMLNVPIHEFIALRRGSADQMRVRMSIFSNEITSYLDTDSEMDIYDLRNAALNLASKIVSAVGFYAGISWQIDISHILCRELDLDFVFGAEIECLVNRKERSQFPEFLKKVYRFNADEAVFLNRCFSDLQAAMSHPIDTPFYCYRAIESLRHLCGFRYRLRKECEQWSKLSQLSGKKWEDTKILKDYANSARHGNHMDISGVQRKEFFIVTWGLVDGFLNSIDAEEAGKAGSVLPPSVPL